MQNGLADITAAMGLMLTAITVHEQTRIHMIITPIPAQAIEMDTVTMTHTTQEEVPHRDGILHLTTTIAGIMKIPGRITILDALPTTIGNHNALDLINLTLPVYLLTY